MSWTGVRCRFPRWIGLRQAVLLPILFCLAALSVASASPDDPAPADTIARLERLCLGAVSTHGLAERLSILESTILGRPGQGTLPERVRALAEAVLQSTPGGIALYFRLNAMEWELYHHVTDRPLLTKLAALEQEIQGRSLDGPLIGRTESLTMHLWPTGRPSVSRVDLIAGALVRVKLLTELSSAVNKAGETVPFVVVETVFLDGAPVIPAGSTGEALIAKVEPPGNYGRDARLTLDFGPVPAMDGTPILLAAGQECVEANKTERMTVRVTAAGMIVLGPAGILSGFFVRGKETVLPAGTSLFVQTVSVTRCLTLSGGDW